MITIQRINTEQKDFQHLVFELDKDLALRNGDNNTFFAQYNKIDFLQYAVVAYWNEVPVGCGALKEFNASSMEVKRMFVLTEWRGKGVAKAVLNELENWAKGLGFHSCVLETGDKMVEAIGLYSKRGYRRIPNYGQYEQITTSLCFEKRL